MSEKKSAETPIDKYYRLSKSLKHYKKSLETAKRNTTKTEKELSLVLKKLWFCPYCNQPQKIPPKKELFTTIESKLNDDDTSSFFKCTYAKCPICEKTVLIEKTFKGNDED